MKYLCSLLLCTLVFLSLPLSGFAEDRISVGVITALTGDLATIGTAVKNGIELARSTEPKKFEHIEFIYEDDQLDPKKSISAYKKLKNQNEIDLLMGFGTVLVQAVGPLVERDKIPFLNINFEAAPVADKKYIVRSLNHTDQFMKPMAELLLKKGYSKFPLVKTEYSFFDAMAEGFKKGLGTSARMIEIANVQPGEQNFRPIILKLKHYQGRPVGLMLFPDQLIAFLRQAKELKFKAEYFGTDLCETAASIEGSGGLLEGCLYPDNNASEKFRTSYKAKYGNEAQLTFAASTYDMAILLGHILKENMEFEAEVFLSSLSKVKNARGALGSYSYKDEAGIGRFFEYPIYIKEIRGSRGVALTQ